MNARYAWLAIGAGISFATGCDRQASEGPPAIRLGDSVCVQCNMIISDVRFATATIVEGPRGPEPRLFDDFNCQVNHEIENPDLPILRHWVHDHAQPRWIDAADAHFVIAAALRTPMASHTAAFASQADAETTAKALGGEILDFETAWKRLGFAAACCSNGHSQNSEHDEGETDAP